MLLLANMKEVTIHAKLSHPNLTAPTTSLLIAELASQSSMILTLPSLNTMLKIVKIREFMVLEEDPSMMPSVQTETATDKTTE